MLRAPDRRAILYMALALLWSIALLVAALVVPAYGSTTLVGENGTGVLLVIAIPAALTLAAWLALWHKCSRGGRAGGYLAWTCVALLGGFCLLGALSIGVFVVPAVIFLARAAALTPAGPGPVGLP